MGRPRPRVKPGWRAGAGGGRFPASWADDTDGVAVAARRSDVSRDRPAPEALLLRRAACILLTVFAIAGCSPAAGDDSSAPPVVPARQTLRIGSMDDSATALTYVREMVVGLDGRIYSLYPQEHAVRIHDADGRLVRTIGREGSGPGEFRSPSRIGLRGDTLWVFDHGTYRFTLFDASGELLESRTVPVELGDATSNPPRPRGLLSDGTVWGSPPAWSDQVADGTITRALNVRLDSSGRVADTIIEYSIANTSWRLHDPSNPRGVRSFREQPFSDADVVVVSEHRPEVVIVERPIASDPARGTFRITKRELDGDTLYSRSFTYAPTPLPPSRPDSLAAAFAMRPASLPPSMAASWPTPARAEELARSSLFVPPFFPPVGNLVVGRDGTVWIQREDAGGETREWWVIDGTGRAVAAVHLPANLRMLAADRDRIWGMETDELDVPYIVRYEL